MALFAQAFPSAATPYRAFSTPGVMPVRNDEQIQKIAQIGRALDNPVTVLEDLVNGEISVAAADAIRESDPELFEEMRVALETALAERRQPLSYEQRLQLAMFLGDPSIEPSIAPESIGTLQASYAQAPGMADGGEMGQPLKSTKDLNSIKGAASAMQRLEGRTMG